MLLAKRSEKQTEHARHMQQVVQAFLRADGQGVAFMGVMPDVERKVWDVLLEKLDVAHQLDVDQVDEKRVRVPFDVALVTRFHRR